MAVKKGYKQTEVGVIPDDWDVRSLGQLSEFITSGSRGWASYYSVHGALFVRSQNVRDGRLDFTDRQCVLPPSGAEVSRTRLKNNDLLVTVTGNSVGNVARVSYDLGDAYVSQHVGLVRLIKPSVAEYLCRFLAPGAPGNPQIWASQTGQSKPGLKLTDLHEFLVALPPTTTEQEAIAGALSDADAWIESLEQLIAKKRQIKQGAMQELLTGKRRLPGFEVASGFKHTDVGEIPENWTVTALGSICKIERGKFTARPRNDPKYYGGDIPFIQTGDVSNSAGVVRKYSQTLNELGLRVSKRFPAGTLFFTIAANIGDIAIAEFNTACPDSLVAISPTNSVHQCWLYHELKRNKSKFEVIASSNAQSNLNLEKIKPFLIPLPATLAEQQAIATVLSDMDTEIESLESKLAKARDIKQGMMQELLTGRIRVVN